KKPALPDAQALEVPDMENSALAVQLHARHPRRGLREKLGRQIGLSARVGSADQTLVAHGPAMGKTENRLKMAGQAEFRARAAHSLDEESVGMRRSQIPRRHSRLQVGSRISVPSAEMLGACRAHVPAPGEPRPIITGRRRPAWSRAPTPRSLAAS